jgi:hypothetical protein
MEILKSSHPNIAELIEGHRGFPPIFTHIKTGKNCFYKDGVAAAFEVTENCIVIAGDLISKYVGIQKIERHERFYESLKKVANDNNKTVCGYYNSESESHPFKRKKMGTSSLIDMKKFTTNGYGARDIRYALNKGKKVDLKFFEVTGQKSNFRIQVKSLYNHWLRSKKRPEIRFWLAPPSEQTLERWFVCYQGVRLMAFVSALPYKNGIYIDNLLHAPGGHPYSLHYLLAKALLQLKSENVQEVSLGLNPFLGLKPCSLTEWVLWLLGKTSILYNSQGIFDFKKKFSKNHVDRYLFVNPEKSEFMQVFEMMKVTYPALFRSEPKYLGLKKPDFLTLIGLSD